MLFIRSPRTVGPQPHDVLQLALPNGDFDGDCGNVAGIITSRAAGAVAYSTLRGGPVAPSSNREKRNAEQSSEGLPSRISSDTSRPAIGPIANP